MAASGEQQAAEGLKRKRELEVEECGWAVELAARAELFNQKEPITTSAAKTCQDYSESIKCQLTTSSSGLSFS